MATSSEEAAAARAKILEGVDFIENEEDAEAVESAVVKIQSTFRGKKIRSKLGQKSAGDSDKSAKSEQQSRDTKAKQTVGGEKEEGGKSQTDSNCSTSSSSSSSTTTTTAQTKATTTATSAPAKIKKDTSKQANKQLEQEELNKKVAKMQVNEPKSNNGAGKEQAAKSELANKSSACRKDPSNATEASSNNMETDEEVERAAAKIQAGFKGYKTRKELEGRLGGGGGSSAGAASGNPSSAGSP